MGKAEGQVGGGTAPNRAHWADGWPAVLQGLALGRRDSHTGSLQTVQQNFPETGKLPQGPCPGDHVPDLVTNSLGEAQYGGRQWSAVKTGFRHSPLWA